jgi:hypothetical protein
MYCYAENVPSYDYNYGYDNVNNAPLDLITLYVPAKALNAYKSRNPWSHFGIILPISDGDTSGIGQNTLPINKENICSISGVRTNMPLKGMNIIRMSDGTVKKVVVK